MKGKIALPVLALGIVASVAAFSPVGDASSTTGTTERVSVDSDSLGLSAGANGESSVGLIVFNPDLHYPVAVMNEDGSSLLVVGGDEDPMWSPNGRYIASGNVRVDEWVGDKTVFVGYFGDHSPHADSGLCRSIDWAPDSSSIVGRVGNTDIAIFNLESGSTRYLTNEASFPGYSHQIWCPSWSPDGTTIAFEAWLTPTSGETQDQRIFLANVATGSLTDLSGPGAHDWAPSWSPDGNKLLFESGDHEFHGLYVMNLVDRSVTPLWRDSANWVNGASWSPDGGNIAFSTWGAAGPSLSVIPSTGGTRRVLSSD